MDDLAGAYILPDCSIAEQKVLLDLVTLIGPNIL